MKKILSYLCALACVISLLPCTQGVKAATSPEINYYVIQGHDGNPDPDDNGATLAGYFAIKRNAEKYGSKVNYVGLVYGDASYKSHKAMIEGGGNSYHGSNGWANYRFYQRYAQPALESVGVTVFYDTTPQDYDFNAKDKETMSTSGRFVADQIVWAINNSSKSKKLRIVYSAGGGQNVPAEAIQYLRNKGYSADKIKHHFAIIQHSKWNFLSQTEVTGQNITRPYTIFISDQNADTGIHKKVPTSVSASRTSELFAKAWAIAVGGEKPVPAIDGFGSIDDISDAGSHSFASNYPYITKYWNTRNNSLDARISYHEYRYTQVIADMCGEDKPEETPEVKPEETPEVKPEEKPEVKPEVEKTVVLNPVQDVYIDRKRAVNNNILRVEKGTRTAYLTFDLSKIKGQIVSVKLKMTCISDPGYGKVTVNLGNDTAWTTSTITRNKPAKVCELASLNQSYRINTAYTWTLNKEKINTGKKINLIMEHVSGNDVAFAASENRLVIPQLEIIYK